MTKRWIKSTVLEHSQHPRVDFGITTPSWVHAQSVEFQRTDDGAARLLERMPQRHQPPAIGAQRIYVDLKTGAISSSDSPKRRRCSAPVSPRTYLARKRDIAHSGPPSAAICPPTDAPAAPVAGREDTGSRRGAAENRLRWHGERHSP